MAFANEWAEGLGIRLSEAVAADALLPELALDLATVETPRVLPGNLQGITVAAGDGGDLTDGGCRGGSAGWGRVRGAAAGWRIWDGAGGTDSASGDLVLRSPVRGFSIPRAEV